MLSTIRSYFQGDRELFEHLALEKLEDNWHEYPVLYLDFNTKSYKTENDLYERLDATLQNWEETYGGTPERSLELRFESIIENAHNKTGKQVVILVDEYDKPLLSTMQDERLLDNYRNTLKAFFSNLKSMDAHIKFAFITGVTKFSKVSIFSDLNNLNDISMDDKYANICGITENELRRYFQTSIQELASTLGMGIDEMSAKLKKQYDGYRFTANEYDGIYNLYSLINAFSKQRLDDFWYETATPTFLLGLLKQSHYDLRHLQEEEVDTEVLNSTDSFRDNPVPVLFQSGYLTIKDYDKEFRTFHLAFPNTEVEHSFLKYLLPKYTPQPEQKCYAFIGHFVKDIRSGNAEQFMQRFKTFFSDNNYQIAGDIEKYFQNAMYLVFNLMRFFTQVERSTSQGRVDVVVQTADYIYIIEIKLNDTAEAAIHQIEENRYAEPFAMDERRLIKIGVKFNAETRGVENWVIA